MGFKYYIDVIFSFVKLWWTIIDSWQSDYEYIPMLSFSCCELWWLGVTSRIEVNYDYYHAVAMQPFCLLSLLVCLFKDKISIYLHKNCLDFGMFLFAALLSKGRPGPANSYKLR